MPKSSDVPSAHTADAGPVRSQLIASQYSILRNSDRNPDLNSILNIPCSDSFSVIIQLEDFASHRLWRGGQLAFKGGHVRESTSIAYLGEEVRCQHLAPYDNLRINLQRAQLEEVLYEEGISTRIALNCPPGTLDPVTYHLTQSLLPALKMPSQVNRLFVEQVVLALCTHISSQYGNVGNWQEPVRGLSTLQVTRAKELIANHLTDGLSVAELAQECSLSRSYFTRAFKQSTGITPHEWLLKMRVEKAKQLMLHTQLNLSQIGLDCGFADQSHFSRVFQRIAGTSPSRWRRFHGAGDQD
ncbi:AraC family transcriptional regulator [Pseudomonas sp. Q1-7]|uniref:AraC family transcriptional regulator n=1 Tax=Pseudomonas sp. Q1-7 TaxID=3020843 RepID=UPI0023004DA6|nr:AraC family transcriptional regulator [Pseudomonas sp. Q1-7]